MAAPGSVRLEGLTPHVWLVAGVLLLSVVYASLEIAVVRPRMTASHPAAVLPGMLLARPPEVPREDPAAAGRILDDWRASYWSPRERQGPRGGWARAHLPRIVLVVAFVGAAIALFLLRSSDLTAALSVLALALSGVAGGGPLYGAEAAVPLGRVLTVFAWTAGAFAFPVIALAILYFPSPSPLLRRFPLLHLVPFAAAAPILACSGTTALYLAGVDGAKGGAIWDAGHPALFYASYAAALAVNVLVLAEGVHRYRVNPDANERRRIRMAVYSGVPGVIGYAVRDGVPIVARLSGGAAPAWPGPVDLLLLVLVLLPAAGLVYAVGVARVLGPRIVLRRSLQYALARRTLTVLPAVPAAALAIYMVRNPEARIRDLVTTVYLGLLAVSAAGFAYRDRARQLLDERFFRQEYDARKILLSLASRVRFETDPSDLASLVVTQVDEALRPEMVAILASGIEEGRLTPVTVLHGSAESLPLDGGLISMVRWSDEPLELFPDDPRSPVHRLPRDEQEWIACTDASLLVPVLSQDRSLLAVIVLGERRSEEAYTSEDRQLLASIAAQMGLGLDVARLRRQLDSSGQTGGRTTVLRPPAARPMTECPRCGRCDEAGVERCAADGTHMQSSGSVPRVIEDKYRLEQLLGRGGMGAVYRARDMRLDRLVAVKVVRPELLGHPDARRRFKREAQIVARLQHPSIVAVHDYGTFADGGAYLVMELVRGEDLRRVLVREGRLDAARAARIIGSVCAAIEAAHREGVLHRDLKPENILLPGQDVEAKVLDFGVAKLVDEPRRERGSPEAATVLTVEGAVIGTPAYMAPEQLRGATPDARTDVFSLGVIAYEMLTGTLPFGRGSLADVILAQARGVPPEGIEQLPPPVARAVRMALEPDPDRRPASPQAFAHLLGAAGGI